MESRERECPPAGAFVSNHPARRRAHPDFDIRVWSTMTVANVTDDGCYLMAMKTSTGNGRRDDDDGGTNPCRSGA